MNKQSYLIDTNIIIGLEDNHKVQPEYAKFSQLTAKHPVDVFVHEVTRDDIGQDENAKRQGISLSKLKKFQILEKVRGLNKAQLEAEFGPLKKHNDIVDATLLHALKIGAVDFLVTQDKGLHHRAEKYSPDIARRVLFVADAAQLLVSTYEPDSVPIRYVEDVSAHTISVADPLFDSLRDRYADFDDWWKNKCVAERRPCWVVYDNEEIAGLIVHKEEDSSNTDATLKGKKILKICTFKVNPEKRGVKLGELLLKQALWYAQKNNYNLVYLTAYEEQSELLSLLEYYGFLVTTTKNNGELIVEKRLLDTSPERSEELSAIEAARLYYPKFIYDNDTQAFCIPIKEDFHDTLYPDLKITVLVQLDLFSQAGPSRAGNTIRKVYLCRANSKLGEPGSLLFFYKSLSKALPSQAITSVGILEEVSLAHSTQELMLLTGGRSVFSQTELERFKATSDRPVKVINYLLVGYADPAIDLTEMKAIGIVKGRNPPQSIYKIGPDKMMALVKRAKLG